MHILGIYYHQSTNKSQQKATWIVYARKAQSGAKHHDNTAPKFMGILRLKRSQPQD